METNEKHTAFTTFRSNLERYFKNPGQIVIDSFDFLQVWWPVMVWLFVAPLLLLGMEQGSDLLVGQFEDSGIYVSIRALSLGFGLLLTGMAIVVLPTVWVAPHHRALLRDRFRPKISTAPNDPNRFRGEYHYVFMGLLPIFIYLVVLFVFHCKRLIPNDCDDSFRELLARFFNKLMSTDGLRQIGAVLLAMAVLTGFGWALKRLSDRDRIKDRLLFLLLGFMMITVAVYGIYYFIFPIFNGLGLFAFGMGSGFLACIGAFWLFQKLDEKLGADGAGPKWTMGITLAGLFTSMVGTGLLACLLNGDYLPVNDGLSNNTRLFAKYWAMVWPIFGQVAFQGHFFRLLDQRLMSEKWVSTDYQSSKKEPYFDNYTRWYSVLMVAIFAAVAVLGGFSSINGASPVFLMHLLMAFFLLMHHIFMAIANVWTITEIINRYPTTRAVFSYFKKHKTRLQKWSIVLSLLILTGKGFMDISLKICLPALVILLYGLARWIWRQTFDDRKIGSVKRLKMLLSWFIKKPVAVDGDKLLLQETAFANLGGSSTKGLVMLTLIFLLLKIVAFPNRHLHETHLTDHPLGNDFERDSFQTYFDKWLAGHTEPMVDVYLVAAQGGGSRAGFWANRVLNELEIQSGFRFHKHCLAISSASGGSSGVASTLALWQFAAEKNLFNTKDTALFQNFAAEMYAHNFLSGPMYDIALHEPMQCFVSRKTPINRGYRQQLEEALAFGEAVDAAYFRPKQGGWERFKSRIKSYFKSGKGPQLTLPGGQKVDNYPFRAYLSYYYDEKGAAKTSLPLFFPITKNIQSGRAGYPCPLSDLAGFAPDALDLIAHCDPSKQRTMTLGGAALLSQSFPIINDYQSVGNVGNFVDGGLFENHGLIALHGIYQKLAAQPEPVRSRLRIHVVFITNNDIENPDTESKLCSQSGLDLSLVSNTHNISGNSKLWNAIMRDAVRHPNDRCHKPIILQRSYGQNGPKADHLPLAKWISDHSIKTATDTLESRKPAIRALVAPIK